MGPGRVGRGNSVHPGQRRVGACHVWTAAGLTLGCPEGASALQTPQRKR